MRRSDHRPPYIKTIWKNDRRGTKKKRILKDVHKMQIKDHSG